MPPSGVSFLRNFIRDPRGTGAVAPATRSLAESVGRVALQAYSRHRIQAGCSGIQVLELGAGTGALTGAIESISPVVVEKDEAWAALLRLRFPHLDVRAQCATDTLAGIDRPTGIVSSIPLL